VRKKASSRKERGEFQIGRLTFGLEEASFKKKALKLERKPFPSEWKRVFQTREAFFFVPAFILEQTPLPDAQIVQEVRGHAHSCHRR
jgi:hypothetical protein